MDRAIQYMQEASYYYCYYYWSEVENGNGFHSGTLRQVYGKDTQISFSFDAYGNSAEVLTEIECIDDCFSFSAPNK